MRWLAGAMALAGLGWKAIDWAPMPGGLEDVDAGASGLEWVDREGRSLRVTAGADGMWRRALSEADVPESVVRCTLAAEDARFFEHGGVDGVATVRALGQWAWNGRVVSGASTITQQRVKLGHPRPRTLRTKVIEVVQAMRLEREWGKERILRSYLSRIDYGNRAEGLAAAAWHYFGKAARDLTWGEAALLAGLPQAPTRLNPRVRMEKARARQAWILGRCVKLGWLDEGAARRALSERLALAPASPSWRAPHFVEVARGSRGVGGRGRQGGRMTTTLDLGLQEACEGIVGARLAGLRERRAGDAALVVLENASGGVLAWVGSPDWGRAGDGQVDGVLARRSPGSALKPMAYLRAFEAGATAADVLADVPLRVGTGTGVFEPRNYDGCFRGPVSHREALAGSLNVPAVRVVQRWGGPGRLLGTLGDFGITVDRGRGLDGGLGMVLGDVEVRLVEVANAYATLARMGWWIPWRVTPGARPEGRRVADEGACWLVADILSDPLARAGEFGMHSALSPGVRVACKTGTSTGFRDNWALGFTPRFTVGVWVGNFDGSPMREVSGVTGAAPILGDVMLELERRHGLGGWFPDPAGLHRERVDPLTGRRPGTGAGTTEEVFLEGRGPAWEGPSDRDGAGRVVLPGEYDEWLAGLGGREGGRFGARGGAGEPVVLSPVAGTRFLLDADAAAGTERVRLRATGGGRWTSPTLRLVGGDAGMEAVLEAGVHRLRVEGLGGSAETWIEVRRR